VKTTGSGRVGTRGHWHTGTATVTGPMDIVLSAVAQTFCLLYRRVALGSPPNALGERFLG
jgi:hypothetical protein